MYRVTTPTHTFTLPIETSTCLEIQITYKQGCSNKLIKHYQDNTLPDGMTLDGKKVIIKLTQEETSRFSEGINTGVQVRVLTNDFDVYASKIFTIMIDDVLSGDILQ